MCRWGEGAQHWRYLESCRHRMQIRADYFIAADFLRADLAACFIESFEVPIWNLKAHYISLRLKTDASAPGRGSRFWVELPVEVESPEVIS